MATVTIQYWAAAKEAAGVELESVDAGTLAEALDVVLARRGDDARLRRVLAASSFLVDGAAASRAAASGVILPDAAVIEVLPQFAGGLAPWMPLADRGDPGGRSPPRGWVFRPHCGTLVINALQCPNRYFLKSHSGAP